MQMDALSLLTADHNRVRGLFSQFDEAKEAEDVDVMAALQVSIFTEVTVHMTIEEEIVYPWSHDLSDEIGDTVEEGVQEHHVVKVLMGEIDELPPGDDAWVAKMTVLIENVQHHAEEEEQELFPKIRSHSDAAARGSLGDELDARKATMGAPVLADKIDLTDDRLHQLATAQAIPGRSKMEHDELAATVNPPA
jgi:hemerythrin superfamily protein